MYIYVYMLHIYAVVMTQSHQKGRFRCRALSAPPPPQPLSLSICCSHLRIRVVKRVDFDAGLSGILLLFSLQYFLARLAHANWTYMYIVVVEP